MNKLKFIFDNLIMFPIRLVFAPFKNFEEIKENKKTGFIFATILIIIYGIVQIFAYQYKVFFLNKLSPKEINGPLIFLGSVIPILLLVIANYLTTTLFDGSGKLKEIYQATGYSLFILIIFQVVSVILSNFITLSDLVLYKVFNVLGVILFSIILFIGLIVVHEFSVGKNIVMIIATFFTFLILLYLIFLAFSLIKQTLGFGNQIIEEIIFRIKK